MNNHRLDIQGLRAIAVFAVVVFHASDLLPGGFLGVDVFFVISGFIIAQLAIVEIKTTGCFSPSNFLQRRLRRLLPTMAIVVLVTLSFGMMVDTPSRMTESLPTAALAALTALINFYFLWGATDYFQTFHSNPLLHLWSLAVEMQFYFLLALTLPIALRVWRTLGLGMRSAIWVLAALTLTLLVCSLTIDLWYRHAGISLPRLFSFFMLPTRLWEFGFGIVGATLQGRFVGRVSRSIAVDALQGGCALAVVIAFKCGSELWNVPGFQAVGPCIAVMILILTGELGFVGRALCWRGMTFFGDRSYSIYLWQGPLIVFASMLYATPLASRLAALGSILLSILTYELVEKKFRSAGTEASGRRTGRIGSVRLYVCVMAACATADAIIGPWTSHFAAQAPMRATTLDRLCQRQRGIPGIKPCVYGAAGRPKVVLTGDSHAGALSQAVIDAAERAGWQTHVATASACAIPQYPEIIAYRASCAGFAHNILSYVRAQKADLVIINQFSQFYVSDLRIGETRWRDGLAAFVTSLADAHIPVLIIADSPRLPLVMGRPLWRFNWSIDLTSSMNARQELARNEREAASTVKGGRYLATSNLFCDGSNCPVFENGAWLYTDADHLSIHGAERLRKPLTDELLRIKSRLTKQ